MQEAVRWINPEGDPEGDPGGDPESNPEGGPFDDERLTLRQTTRFCSSATERPFCIAF